MEKVCWRRKIKNEKMIRNNFFEDSDDDRNDYEREENPNEFDENYLNQLIDNNSNKFQWLPSEFEISREGKVKILSYINNLYPKTNKELYSLIENIFEKFIPLFEKTLSYSKEYIINKKRINPNDIKIKELDDIYNEIEINNHLDSYLDYHINPFIPSNQPSFITLKNRKLQVITKIGSTILDFNNPFYKGGVWHVEGMSNEHIVATGIYYFDSENISESKLEFRVNVFDPYSIYDLDQDDIRPRCIYNIGRGDYLNNHLGYTIAEEGRCICFPNIYQHKVSPFELMDKNKSGYRKILVFFLVDPNIRIKSTLTVSPQQGDWMWNELILKKKRKGLKSKFNLMSKNLLLLIWEYYGGNITQDEAEKYRLQLMKERKYFYDKHTKHFYEREYSFCEH